MVKKSEYNWVKERFIKELTDRKLEFTVEFEQSNHGIDLLLAVRIEKVQCPTCFGETHWRSSIGLFVDIASIDFNKLPQWRQEKEIGFFLERVDKATRRF